ncbi:MAG: flagellin FliC, partial [Limnohabitans sp.]
MKLAFLLPATAMNVINTNIRAQFAQAALSMVERRQSVAMERLSTGKRINSARDDAAGLAIAARMSELIRGTHQAIQNANNGIGMIQTAESAAGQIGDRLQRMRELAVQAANGTYSDAQRGAMDMEYQQLKQDIAAVSRNTRWNGMSLMDAKAGTLIAPKALYKAVSAGQVSQLYGGKTSWAASLYDSTSNPVSVSQSSLTAVSTPIGN